ncbi:MAG: tyrosine-protein kinase family protein [Thiotrichales bacterium]
MEIALKAENRVKKSKIAKAVALSKENKNSRSGYDDENIKTFNVLPENKVRLDFDEVRKNRILLGDKKEQSLMEYNLLRTQVYNAMKQSNSSVLAVTSGGPSEGKSVTSVNLALSLSRSVAKNVVLVDFDLHRPTVHEKLNLKNQKGLSDYYLGKAKFEEIVFQDEFTGLYFIPGLGELENASDVIGKRGTAEFLKELRHSFPSRVVILDTPPVLVVDDVSALLNYIDKVLLVVSEGKSQKDDLRRVMELIGKDKIMGTVLNNSKELKRKKSGYYGHYSKS